MTIIGSDSISVLARAILELRLESAFDEHLDELLIWLNKGGTDGALTARLELHGVSLDTALQRALELIDQHLFVSSHGPYRVLGLSPDTADETIRLRYRRLIQAFHPDRQLHRQSWLTERTERLNAAYRAIKNKEAQPSPPPQPNRHKPRKTEHQAAAASLSTEVSFSAELAHRLRALLGAGRSFERRFFAVLFALCLAFLGYLYYINKPPSGLLNTPPYRIASEPEQVVLPAVPAKPEENFATASPATDKTPSLPKALVTTAVASDSASDSASAEPSPTVVQPLLESTDLEKISSLSDPNAEAISLGIEPLEPNELAQLTMAEALPMFLSDQWTLDERSEPAEPKLQSSYESLTQSFTTVTLAPEKSIPIRVAESKPERSRETKLDTASAAKVLVSKTDQNKPVPVNKPQSEKPSATTKLAAKSKPETEKTSTKIAMIQPVVSATAKTEPAGLAVCGDFLPFLAQYSSSYNRGDARAYAGLFSRSGTENQLRGRGSIQQTYQNWFRQTDQRRLQLQNLAGRPISAKRCLVQGRYSVSYRKLGGDRAAQNGRIEFLLEQNDRSYKIISVRY